MSLIVLKELIHEGFIENDSLAELFRKGRISKFDHLNDFKNITFREGGYAAQ
jgi:hypothetical protein